MLTKGICSAIIIFVIVLVCFLIWLHNMLDDSLTRKEIFNLVNENYAAILKDIEEENFAATLSINGVKEVYYHDECLDIYCGGRGMGSATSYYGFYYSPDDLPKTCWAGSIFGEIANLKTEGNGFSIRNPNDDNWYYTEKIRDNFYYYEAHF